MGLYRARRQEFVLEKGIVSEWDLARSRTNFVKDVNILRVPC